MQAEVEIGQQRSARQFAADTWNPRRMTTLAFFRVVRKMIVVSWKLCLCLKTVILAVCMCGPKFQINVIFARIHNPPHIRFTPLPIETNQNWHLLWSMYITGNSTCVCFDRAAALYHNWESNSHRILQHHKAEWARLQAHKPKCLSSGICI